MGGLASWPRVSPAAVQLQGERCSETSMSWKFLLKQGARSCCGAQVGASEAGGSVPLSRWRSHSWASSAVGPRGSRVKDRPSCPPRDH